MRKQHTILIFSSFTIGLITGCGGGDNASETINPSSSGVAPVITPIQTVAKPIFSKNPAANTQLAYAQFTFEATQANGFECQLGDQAYKACESPVLIYPIDAGAHSFSVRTKGSSGSFSEPSTVKWQVSSIFGDSHLASPHTDLIKTTVQPQAAAAQSWRGIFRINCDFAHASYNDPIVYPNQADAAHLHRFYGNTLVDEKTTEASLFTTGESSCQGNELHRSAYWMPALLAPAYDPQSGQRLIDGNGAPAWTNVEAVVGNDDAAHEVFYYSAGIDDIDAIQPIPLGLKMLAGTAMTMPNQPQDTSIVRWHCQSWQSDDSSNPRWSATIPICNAPDRVRLDIFFPSCWNGLDLDSADHKSHMAYPVSSGGRNTVACPATHPIPIVRVSYHYAFGVKPENYEPKSKSSKGWRLASDMYEVTDTMPGGASLHSDWFNAWHPEAMNALLTGCIKKRLDCHDGNLANGYRLSGTRPGTQVEPAIINEGKGPKH